MTLKPGLAGRRGAMNRDERRRRLLRHSSMGVEFTFTFAVPLCIGLWLDGKTDTLPGFTLLGAAIGFAVGLWRLIKQGKQVQREQQDDGDDEGAGEGKG